MGKPGPWIYHKLLSFVYISFQINSIHLGANILPSSFFPCSLLFFLQRAFSYQRAKQKTCVFLLL